MMQLPDLTIAPVPDQPFYLAVLLTDDWLQVGLWQVIEGKIGLVNQSGALSFTDEESCLTTLDQALQTLGPHSEGVSTTVFGLDGAWLANGELASAKKAAMKTITSKLSLTAVGFMPLIECVTHFLTATEAFFSALVIRETTAEFQVSLLQRGELKGTESVGRSGDAVADMTEALARFDQRVQPDHLPSQMMIFGLGESSSDLEATQQALLALDWSKQFSFLHQPTVTIMPTLFAIQTVVITAGKAYVESQGMEVNSTPTTESTTMFDFAPVEDIDPIKEKRAQTTENHLPQPTDELSFATTSQKEWSESDSLLAVSENPFSSYGQVESDQAVATPDHPSANRKEIKSSWLQVSAKSKARSSKSLILPILMGFIGGLVILAVIGGWWATKTVKFVVTMVPQTQSVSQEIRLLLDPEATQLDLTTKTLPATIVEQEITLTQQADTTGTATLGERASGQVTIINKTTGEKTFAQGTKLSAGSLSIILSDAVTVASASVETSDEAETKTFGKQTVAAVAAEIGEEGNIAQGTTLKVADFDSSSFTAEVSSAFAGGSSREVQVVSVEDRAQLLKAAQAAALAQAAEDFAAQQSSDQTLIPTSNLTIASQEFSDSVGAEATELSLTLTVRVQAVAYQKSQLKLLAQDLLSSQVPAGFRLSEQSPQILSEPVVDEDQDVVTLDAQLTALIEPAIDAATLSQQYGGQPLAKVSQQLADLPSLKQATIQVSPAPLGFFFRTFPQSDERLTFSQSPTR